MFNMDRQKHGPGHQFWPQLLSSASFFVDDPPTKQLFILNMEQEDMVLLGVSFGPSSDQL